MKKTKKIVAAALLTGIVFLLAGCTYDRAALNGTENAAASSAAASSSDFAKTPESIAPSETGTSADAAVPAPKDAAAQAEIPTGQAQPGTSQMSAPAAPAVSANMTMEEARALALSSAGLKESDVMFTETSFEYDDGMNLWQIGFVAGTTEYEYDINADTKAVVGYDMESIYD